MECISKQAYYNTNTGHIALVSLSDVCDQRLMKAVHSASRIPKNLKIDVIIRPEDFDKVLQTARIACSVEIVEKLDANWLFLDCIDDAAVNKKSEESWIMATCISTIAIFVCAGIAICCCLIFRPFPPLRRRNHQIKKLESVTDSMQENNINQEAVHEPIDLTDQKYSEKFE
ncbi:unnamed protein product [Thelazia callipaeda]|uniref:Col_cuticle_N domain-containing protein n=1 Tax=Thelazia callipaeda TaxID=103827 RepID=A0A0N5CQV8_THECL|nr:unnamed protein product [Thelazia callipaeda]